MSNIIQFPKIRKPVPENTPQKQTVISRPAATASQQKPKVSRQPAAAKKKKLTIPQMIFNFFSSAVWFVFFLLWPVIQWVFGFAIVYRVIMIFVRWDTPGAHPVWAAVFHVIVLCCLMFYYEHGPILWGTSMKDFKYKD